MVAVVVILQIIMGLLQSPAVHFCHSFQFRLEVLSDFFFCDAADGSIFWKETDIGQVVENREERNLRKLGNARDEDETLVGIVSLQNGKTLLYTSVQPSCSGVFQECWRGESYSSMRMATLAPVCL